MSLSLNLTCRYQGEPTGRLDVNGEMIHYGDHVECHFFYCIGGRLIGYASGWGKEVREVLFDEENNCPALWLKAINSYTDPDDWDNDREVGYLVKLKGQVDYRIEWLRENDLYDETCEFSWLAQITASKDIFKHQKNHE